MTMNESNTNTCSLEIDETLASKIRSDFSSYEGMNTNPYVDFFAKKDGVSIILYKPNKKNKIKVVFQGNNADKIFGIYDNASSKKEKIINLFPQIGSDEVGTGDFFGPVCVCAAFVKERDLPFLKELGVTDSKKMNDEYIFSIGPTLIKRFDYSQLSLPNEKFNQIKDSINMNGIKAKMHNRCLLNLKEKHPEASIYQDQFAEEGLYYHYLKDETYVVKNITFHTKGESLFPSVALASVIARYSFLKKMMAMEEKYGLSFPLGAGKPVDDFIPLFVSEYGEEELKKVAKLSWANYRKYLENKQTSLF